MIKNVLRILRSEYFFGLWIGCIANLILWFDPSRSPSLVVILLTLLYAGLFYLSGFLADSIWDADLEITYGNEKRELAVLVKDLGRHRLRALLLVCVVFSAVLSLLLAWLINSPMPFILFIVGLVFGIGYSVPPLRFKQRGFLLHAISLSISAFFLPVFLLAGILQGGGTYKIFIIGIGYSMAHYAMEIGNQLKDQKYDNRLELQTLPYPDLLSNATTALILLVVGLTLIGVMLSVLFGLSNLLIVTVGIVIVGTHSGPLLAFWKSLRGIYNLDYFLTLNYASWQTRSMVGLLILSILIRL